MMLVVCSRRRRAGARRTDPSRTEDTTGNESRNDATTRALRGVVRTRGGRRPPTRRPLPRRATGGALSRLAARVFFCLGGGGAQFRPYDLVVVAQQDAGSDYYTMSAAGLVHVKPNDPSEFIALSEWMRQSTLFNMLRSIRFYKYYLHSKCFNLWRSNVRYKLCVRDRSRRASTISSHPTERVGSPSPPSSSSASSSGRIVPHVAWRRRVPRQRSVVRARRVLRRALQREQTVGRGRAIPKHRIVGVLSSGASVWLASAASGGRAPRLAGRARAV